MSSKIKKILRNLDTDEKIEVYQYLFEDLEESERGRLIAAEPAVKPMESYFDKAIDAIRHPGVLTGLSTGFQRLDMVTGGFDRQEMIVIAGPTGRGKTMLSQNILYNMARKGIPSLFFSLEMSEIETTQRFITMHQSDSQYPEEVKSLPVIYYAGKADLKPDNIGVQIREAIDRYGVKIVCIDHLHYFARSVEHEREELDTISRAVKRAAREHDIPIILISHTRKLQDDDAAAHESDLKGTSAIAQDADQVIMVNRKKLSPDLKERNTLHVSVEKNRIKGRDGVVKFDIDKNWRLKEEPSLLISAKEIYVDSIQRAKQARLVLPGNEAAAVLGEND